MAKVLVITKSDKTRHVVHLINEATLKAYSNRNKLNWKFEEMEEAEATKLPYIDETYVSAAEAQTKVVSLESALSEKDAKIAELEKLLAEKTKVPAKAEEVIAKINEATTAAQVDELIAGESRKTVLDAAEKKKASL